MNDYSDAWHSPEISSYTYHEGHIDGPLPLLSAIKDISNLCLLGVLIVGLILGTYLIYRRHKLEKGLWKRFLKWNAIFLLIIFVLWIGFSFVFWYLMGPFADPQTISFEN